MTQNRILAVVVAAALVGGALFTAHASGAVSPRDTILADLTEISCEVLTQEHSSATLFRADAALRSVVRDVALSRIVETPSSFGRSTDQLVLSLAAEARDRFKSPPDRILVDTAVTTGSVIALLQAERVGPDLREEAWFFGPMRSWTVNEGSAFDVALGVCPTVTPGEGATVTAMSSDQRVLADTAFTVKGATLRVQTAPYPADGTTGATVTVTVTTKSGLSSIAEFVVSVLHVVGPPPPPPTEPTVPPTPTEPTVPPTPTAPPTTQPAPPTTQPAPPTTQPAPPTTQPAPPTTEPAPPTTVPAPPTTVPAPPTTQPAPPTTVPAPPTTQPAPPTTVPPPPTLPPAVEDASGSSGRDDRDDDDDNRRGSSEVRERLWRDLAYREEEAALRIMRFLARFTGALRW